MQLCNFHCHIEAEFGQQCIMMMATFNDSNEVFLEGITASCILLDVTQPSKTPETGGHSHSCIMRWVLSCTMIICMYHDYMNNSNFQYTERQIAHKTQKNVLNFMPLHAKGWNENFHQKFSQFFYNLTVQEHRQVKDWVQKWCESHFAMC